MHAIEKRRKQIGEEYKNVADPLLASAEIVLQRVSSIKEFKDKDHFFIALKHLSEEPINIVQIGKLEDTDDYDIKNDLVVKIWGEQNDEIRDRSGLLKSSVMKIGNVIVGLNGLNKDANGALLMGIALNAGLVGYDESIQKIHDMGLTAAGLFSKYIDRIYPKAE